MINIYGKQKTRYIFLYKEIECLEVDAMSNEISKEKTQPTLRNLICLAHDCSYGKWKKFKFYCYLVYFKWSCLFPLAQIFQKKILKIVALKDNFSFILIKLLRKNK